jgi:hypothetical protein
MPNGTVPYTSVSQPFFHGEPQKNFSYPKEPPPMKIFTSQGNFTRGMKLSCCLLIDKEFFVKVCYIHKTELKILEKLEHFHCLSRDIGNFSPHLIFRHFYVFI